MANQWVKLMPFAKVSAVAFNELNNEANNENPFSSFSKELGDHLKSVTSDAIYSELNFNYYTTNKLNGIYKKVEKINELSIFHVNIHSLNANYRGLLLLLSQLNFHFDIIVLAEIWTYNISFFEGVMDGYSFYYSLPEDSNIGGVGIFIKNDIVCKNRDDLKLARTENTGVEDVWLEISKDNKQYVIAGIYRHPGTDYKAFTNKMEISLHKLPKKKKNLTCIIVGDINIDLCKHNADKGTGDYLNTIITCDFLPIIIMPTRITPTSATIIDHIYVSYNSSTTNFMGGNIIADLTDHLPNFVFINSNNPVCSRMKKRTFIRLYTDKNNLAFRKGIKEVNWRDLFADCEDVDKLYDLFINKIDGIFRGSYPLVKMSRRAARDKEWITKGIKISSSRKNKLYKRWLKTKNDCDLIKYKEYKKLFNKLVRTLEFDYYNLIFNSKVNSIKQVWNEINKLGTISKKRKNNTSSIPKLNVDGAEITNSKQICEVFNEYFCDIAGNIVKTIPKSKVEYGTYMPERGKNSMFMKPVNKEEMLRVIEAMNPRKASGYDEISVKLIQDSCYELVDPLLYICNLSFSEGIVPAKLKTAKVVPIHKKDDKHSVKNYRPISLLSNFDKILEKLFYKRLMCFLNKHDILYKYQFGFRTHHSTSLALIDVIDNVYDNLDNDNYVIGVFLDLQKAFDTVQHDILLNKLDIYGIRGIANDWVRSYLNCRNQFVVVDGSKSSSRDITCGVPQGSILGPLLFLIYVNDMWRAAPDCSIKLFADDTNLFMSGKNLQLLGDKVNKVLDNIIDWINANKLAINYDKTNYSIFSPKAKIKDVDSPILKIQFANVLINRVERSKYLGMILDDKLNWIGHIEYVYKKIVKFTSLFYRLREILPTSVLRNLYFALVYPHIMYGIELYANTYQTYLDQLIKTNNKILRILLRRKLDTPVVQLYKSYNTLPIPLLFRYNINILVHKVLFGPEGLPAVYRDYFCVNNDIHEHNTRHCRDLHRSVVNSAHGFRSVREIGPRIWNNTPGIIQKCRSALLFKKKLKEHYMLEFVNAGHV